MIINVKRPSPLTVTIPKPDGKEGERVDVTLNPGLGGNDIPDAQAKLIYALDVVKAWAKEGWISPEAFTATPPAERAPQGNGNQQRPR